MVEPAHLDDQPAPAQWVGLAGKVRAECVRLANAQGKAARLLGAVSTSSERIRTAILVPILRSPP